jgi:hypothetical protein
VAIGVSARVVSSAVKNPALSTLTDADVTPRSSRT